MEPKDNPGKGIDKDLNMDLDESSQRQRVNEGRTDLDGGRPEMGMDEGVEGGVDDGGLGEAGDEGVDTDKGI